MASYSGATVKIITDDNWDEILVEVSALVGTLAHVTERFWTMALSGNCQLTEQANESLRKTDYQLKHTHTHNLGDIYGRMQSHCWAYTPRKPELKETHAPQCSLQHCL